MMGVSREKRGAEPPTSAHAPRTYHVQISANVGKLSIVARFCCIVVCVHTCTYLGMYGKLSLAAARLPSPAAEAAGGRLDLAACRPGSADRGRIGGHELICPYVVAYVTAPYMHAAYIHTLCGSRYIHSVDT